MERFFYFAAHFSPVTASLAALFGAFIPSQNPILEPVKINTIIKVVNKGLNSIK